MALLFCRRVPCDSLFEFYSNFVYCYYYVRNTTTVAAHMVTPSVSDTTTEADHTLSAELRGETIAYAVQSGVYNLAANFVEPYINYRIQQRYSGPDARHHGPHGSYTQNLVGEFAGDLIGCSTLILAETIMPTQLHTFTRTARTWIDPLYTRIAHAVLATHRSDTDYEQQIERWKTFQERSLIRSTIMATAGIVGNVATQKMLVGNPSPSSLIFKGKLVSTAITTALGLVARFALPQQTRRMDKWIGNHLSPMMEDKAMPTAGHVSHAERLSLTAQESQPHDLTREVERGR